MDAKILGSFIAEQRKQNNMTQAQLAKKLNVTDKAVSKWERGIGIPDISNIEALARTFDISIAELIQCKRHEETTEDIPQEVDNIVNAVFDIAIYQKKVILFKLLLVLVLSISGVVLLLVGINDILIYTSVGVVSADGPTAVFVAGKSTSGWPILSIIAGCTCIFMGIWQVIGRKH